VNEIRIGARPFHVAVPQPSRQTGAAMPRLGWPWFDKMPSLEPMRYRYDTWVVRESIDKACGHWMFAMKNDRTGECVGPVRVVMEILPRLRCEILQPQREKVLALAVARSNRDTATETE
jgi:hypothetical protein